MITIPTLSQLYTRIISAIETEFSDTAGRVLQALARVQAGNLKLYYLAIGELQNNIWVDTCDDVTLDRFGLGWLGRLRFPATQGQYNVTVTGSIGGVIPASTTFTSNDNSLSPGYRFVLDNTYTLTGTSGTITLRALTGGVISKLAVGNGLTANSQLLNVNQNVVVTSEVVAPVDAESVALYRQKILDKVRLVPGSWSAIDYRLVGTEIAGVGQIYAYNRSGVSNEVNVFIEGVSTDSPPYVPSGTVITNVQTATELKRPLTVFLVHYLPVTVNQIDVTITMGAFPSFNPSQQAAIERAIEELINGIRPFIAACDPVADRNDVLAIYNLSAAISGAVPGYGFSSVSFTVDSSAASTYTADNGNIPYTRSINYV
jgi:uncharacterized phage protein gp47/JayE